MGRWSVRKISMKKLLFLLGLLFVSSTWTTAQTPVYYQGGGAMTWPAGGAAIPNYSGSGSWATSYNAANPIPLNFLTIPGSTTQVVTNQAGVWTGDANCTWTPGT